MPIELPPQYDPKSVEKAIYQKWLDSRVFHAVPDARPPEQRYAIVIPPPNVTGALHLGHAINGTIQDVLARYHRMRGDNTLWMPGIDHAGIATQAVVEKSIFEREHKTRHDLGRDELVKRIWAWKEQFGTRILSQLQSIGASCDWDRTRFTLDETCAKAVREAFFKMFQDGLIFRGKRLVNWDTHLQTAVADDEIYHETVKGQMTSIKYPVAPDVRSTGFSLSSPETEYLIVATTRPETMLGDTAVAVHPDDPRYKHLIGRHVILPLVGRKIPIIADGLLVDPAFGTGVVKVTPAHDPNDYATGVRHNLEQINLLTPDGKVNENGAGEFLGKKYSYVGLKFATAARKQVLADLEALGLIADKKVHEHEVGHSDRSKTPIEPYMSDQWFVRMGDIGQPAEAGKDSPPSREVSRASGEDALPSGTVPPPSGKDFPSSGEDPLPSGNVPLPSGNDSPPSGNVSLPPGNVPLPPGNESLRAKNRDFESKNGVAASAHPNAAPTGVRLADGTRAPGLAQAAIDAVASGRVKITPDRYAKGYVDWLAQKRDWCISRQLWWGHRIPVWRSTQLNGSETAELLSRPLFLNSDTAYKVADWTGEFVPAGHWLLDNGPFHVYLCSRSSDSQMINNETIIVRPSGALQKNIYLNRDPDVLDTWFSSALWPISTMGWPASGTSDQPEDQILPYFYPTSLLSTAREILTLWVARMVIFGLYCRGDVPFKDVYIHAVIQDGEGRPMKKTLGNGVDPVDIVHSHGADALRFTLASMATETQDIRLPVQLVCPHCHERIPNNINGPVVIGCPKCKKQLTRPVQTAVATPEAPMSHSTSDRFDLGRNFANKVWNAARYILTNITDTTPSLITHHSSLITALEDRWILSRLHQTIRATEAAINAYRFADMAEALRTFFWTDLCDWYLEIAKSRIRGGDALVQSILLHCLRTSLKLLHPVMPFITEELWSKLSSDSLVWRLPGDTPIPLDREFWDRLAVLREWLAADRVAITWRSGKPLFSPSGEMVFGMDDTSDELFIGVQFAEDTEVISAIESFGFVRTQMLITTPWPASDPARIDPAAETQITLIQSLTSAIREIQNRYPAAKGKDILLAPRDAAMQQLIEQSRSIIEPLVGSRIAENSPTAQKPENAAASILPDGGGQIFIAGVIDKATEIAKLTKRQAELEKVIPAGKSKLANEAAVAKAPPKVVQGWRDQLAKQEEELAAVIKNLSELA